MNSSLDIPGYSYKNVKTSLSSIVTDYDVVVTLNETVLMAHRIAIHTLQFLKMYLIHYIDTTQQLPLVNHALILNIMKILAPKQAHGGSAPKTKTAELQAELQLFYLQYYQPTMATEAPLTYRRMTEILRYMVVMIETAYLNNIKQHFVSCVERYVNVYFEKQARVEAIKTNDRLSSIEKKAQLARLSALLRQIKTDILSLRQTLLSPLEYHQFIMQTRIAILPQKASYLKNSVYYDLQSHPHDYLHGMFQMIRYIEYRDAKIINLFPLRTSIVPKYIRIDTTTLVELLIEPHKHGHTKTYYKSKRQFNRTRGPNLEFIF
jgi:hypothetical protein